MRCYLCLCSSVRADVQLPVGRLYLICPVCLSHCCTQRHRQTQCDSPLTVPLLSFAKDSLYHGVFFIPEQMEQRVFATEVRLSHRRVVQLVLQKDTVGD